MQKAREDGHLNLHTRSLKYGKLGPGVLIIVSPSLIRRRKQHIHNLPCGVTAILATNGFVYFCPLVEEDISIVKEVDSATRENICRLRQVTLSLAKHRVSLYDSSLLYGKRQTFFKIVKIFQDLKQVFISRSQRSATNRMKKNGSQK